MLPLIDADLIAHEVSACGQYLDPESGELVIRDFDFVAQIADQRIKEICAEVWATEAPRLYFTGDRALTKSVNKSLKRQGKEQIDFKPNFRFAIAKKVEYKGARKNPKPFHFHNLREYLMATYEFVVAEGYEADDLLCIDLTKDGDNLSVVCCSRDKDLRMVPGLHYGWAVGKQQAFGPKRVTEIGDIELVGGKKLVGTGLKFFYSQVIMGDRTDSIPGLPRGGPVTAYQCLSECETEAEMFEGVSKLYEAYYGESWREEMYEQCHLLYMIRELNTDGSPKLYVMPDQREIGQAA